MKKQLLTFAIMFFSSFVFAQKTDSVIFNGVTKVIIKNKLSAEENYKAAGKLLLDQGYNIGKKDSEFYQISSEPIKVAATGVAHAFSISVVCKDNSITITPKSKNLSSFNMVSWKDTETTFEPVVYKKLRDLTKTMYSKITLYSKGFNPDQITYSE